MLKIVSMVLLGLALFVFGINLLNQALKSLSLEKIKTLMGQATANRIKAFLVGLGVTSIIQSSSATSVIVIGLINAGVLNLIQAVPIIIGANIGTTITAQLIAFKLTAFAPFIVVVGVALNLLSKSIKWKNISLSIFGFGLLFYGLSVMSGAVAPLKESQVLVNMFTGFGKHPFRGIMAGMLVTMILQSSSVTIGIMQAIAIAGLIDFRVAFYLLLGENIGTCITAVIASFGGSNSAKRLAMAHMFFNVFGTVIAVILAGLYLNLIPLTAANVSRQIANAHTAFNVFTALLFLPVIPWYVKFIEFIYPRKDYLKRETQYLDKNLLDTPSLAINVAVQEMVVMAQACGDMLDKATACLRKFDYKTLEDLSMDESSVDGLQKNITNYVALITQHELSDKEMRLIPNLIHSINDLERVGDHIENLGKILRRRHETKIVFSGEAFQEMETIFGLDRKMLELAVLAMRNDDHNAAMESIKFEERINQTVIHARDSHTRRLCDGMTSADKAVIYTDMLTQLERIGDHLYNITNGIIHHGKR